jgi:hypothetical protein
MQTRNLISTQNSIILSIKSSYSENSFKSSWIISSNSNLLNAIFNLTKQLLNSLSLISLIKINKLLRNSNGLIVLNISFRL